MSTLTQKAFNILRSIKSVSVATISDGSPSNRIMDVMLAEKNILYFITARGKQIYKQLRKTPKIALCAIDKNYTMIRVKVDIKFCEQRNIIDKIFEKNPILNTLYPNKKREILEAFKLFKGQGEIFELSKSPIVRSRFAFGGENLVLQTYTINDNCVFCGKCFEVCPSKAIIRSVNNSYSITISACLECGACFEVCPANAIARETKN